MIVTINTDAAFHSQHKLGAYAFWIKCDVGVCRSAGVLKKKISLAEQAEFQCIINALHTLIKLDYKNVNKVIINTDCLNVLHLVKKDKVAIQKYRLASWGDYLVSYYDLLLHQNKLTNKVELRHVKAHESTDTKRQWVNDWADKTAKQKLWEKINSKA